MGEAQVDESGVALLQKLLPLESEVRGRPADIELLSIVLKQNGVGIGVQGVIGVDGVVVELVFRSR